MKVTVGKQEVRQFRQYESNRYTVTLEEDINVKDPEQVKKFIEGLFMLINEEIKKQKEKDNEQK